MADVPDQAQPAGGLPEDPGRGAGTEADRLSVDTERVAPLWAKVLVFPIMVLGARELQRTRMLWAALLVTWLTFVGGVFGAIMAWSLQAAVVLALGTFNLVWCVWFVRRWRRERGVQTIMGLTWPTFWIWSVFVWEMVAFLIWAAFRVYG